MPHILINCCDLERNLQTLVVHADLHFKHEYYTSPKLASFVEGLKAKLEQVTLEYFDDFESEILSNHEYNKHK